MSSFTASRPGIWGDRYTNKKGEETPVINVMVAAGRIKQLFPSEGKTILDSLDEFVKLLWEQLGLTDATRFIEKTDELRTTDPAMYAKMRKLLGSSFMPKEPLPDDTTQEAIADLADTIEVQLTTTAKAKRLNTIKQRHAAKRIGGTSIQRPTKRLVLKVKAK